MQQFLELLIRKVGKVEGGLGREASLQPRVGLAKHLEHGLLVPN
jgi:hypothetical protein